MEFNDNEGWVKLPRAITKTSVGQDKFLFWVYCQLLLQASHKPTIIKFGAHDFALKANEVVISQRAFAHKHGISRDTLRQCLKALSFDGYLKMQDHSGGTLIEIYPVSSNIQRPQKVHPGEIQKSSDDLTAQTGLSSTATGLTDAVSGLKDGYIIKKEEEKNGRISGPPGGGRVLEDENQEGLPPENNAPELGFAGEVGENYGVDENDEDSLDDDDVELLPEPADKLNDWVFGILHLCNASLVRNDVGMTSLVDPKNKAEMGKAIKLVKGAIKTIAEKEKCDQRQAVWRILAVHGMMENEFIAKKRIPPLVTNVCSMGFLKTYLAQISPSYFNENATEFPQDSTAFYQEMLAYYEEMMLEINQPKQRVIEPGEPTNLWNGKETLSISPSTLGISNERSYR